LGHNSGVSSPLQSTTAWEGNVMTGGGGGRPNLPFDVEIWHSMTWMWLCRTVAVEGARSGTGLSVASSPPLPQGPGGLHGVGGILVGSDDRSALGGRFWSIAHEFGVSRGGDATLGAWRRQWWRHCSVYGDNIFSSAGCKAFLAQ
jgi:hypothetical protein